MRNIAVLLCVLLAASSVRGDDATEGRDVTKLADSTKAVVAAIVTAGKKNQQLPLASDPGAKPPFRREKDELMIYYVREAALAAQKLPKDEAVPAFLLALGIAMDDSDLMRKNLVTRRFWAKVESDDDRKRRLAVLGEPAAQGRHDLCQHFSVSAALTVMLGTKQAEAAGIVKEMLDSRDPNNGFSFNDLSADIAGVAFAEKLLKDPALLGRVAESFKVADYTIAPKYEPEGLPAKDFAKMFGSVTDDRFLDRKKEIWQKVLKQPGFSPGKDEKP